jgi:hypothetical protein
MLILGKTALLSNSSLAQSYQELLKSFHIALYNKTIIIVADFEVS